MMPRPTAEVFDVSPDDAERAVAHAQMRKRNGSIFERAYQWVADIWAVQLMLQDPHVPGNELACTVSGLAAYLVEAHIRQMLEDEEDDEEPIEELGYRGH